MANEGVHATHCCARHGCKYGYDYDSITDEWTEKRCPVVNGSIKQEYRCEYCIDPAEARKEIEHLLEEIKFVEGLGDV